MEVKPGKEVPWPFDGWCPPTDLAHADSRGVRVNSSVRQWRCAGSSVTRCTSKHFHHKRLCPRCVTAARRAGYGDAVAQQARRTRVVRAVGALLLVVLLAVLVVLLLS